MKIIKIPFLTVGAGLLILFGYANVRHRSVTEKLKPVNLISFRMSGELNADERLILEKQISAVTGITACSLDTGGNTASITFYPELITEQRLTSLLAAMSDRIVSPKEISSTAGCPVHEVSRSFQHFLTTLDIRN